MQKGQVDFWEQSEYVNGALCGKYQVVRELGRGGMGEVLLVRDLHLNRLAAAKRMQTEGVGDKQKGWNLKIYKKEMELLRELWHKALPAVYDFFQEGKWFYLVMEYVEGITLEQYLRQNGKVSVEMAVQWAVELTEVLEYLHSRQPMILYRDLKPGNIMISPGGEIRLVDLGGCLKSHYGRETEAGYLGTLGYSAPEQWKQTEALQAGCDIYSLGAVLHEMLTGISPLQPPYERRALREYDRSLPEGLERIILKCTKTEMKERYSSMAQVREALKNYPFIGRRKQIQEGIGKLLSLCLWLSFTGCLLFPLKDGVPREQFFFPYLCRPGLLLAAAVLFQKLCFKRDKRFLKRVETSIYVTEKKFVGL